VKKCSLALKDAIHEQPSRFRHREHDREKDHYLCNAKYSHINTSIDGCADCLMLRASALTLRAACIRSRSSELLRTQQRVHQVNEKKNRCNSGNCVFHFSPPQSLSAAFVKPQIRAKKTRTTPT
jgi:hypothetical protein